MEWPLVLRTGFGNVHGVGRWGHTGALLIAEAYNTEVWDHVAEYASSLEWSDSEAN